MTHNKEIKGGLRALPEDKRDFKLSSIYKMPKVYNLPAEFMVVPANIVGDQVDTDMCTAYATAGVNGDQEGIDFDPNYQWAKIRQIIGNLTDWGADLRTASKSARKFGSLPKNKMPLSYPFSWQTAGKDFIADYRNWPEGIDDIAKEYRKDSFFTPLDEKQDVFDSIRLALWKGRKKKRSVLVGANWFAEWTPVKDGIIPNNYGGRSVPHAFRIVGVKKIKTAQYLVCVLSNGKDIGDNGLFYMPRHIANREIVYGAYCFRDLDPEVVKLLNGFGWPVELYWLGKVILSIKNMFQ